MVFLIFSMQMFITAKRDFGNLYNKAQMMTLPGLQVEVKTSKSELYEPYYPMEKRHMWFTPEYTSHSLIKSGNTW